MTITHADQIAETIIALPLAFNPKIFLVDSNTSLTMFVIDGTPPSKIVTTINNKKRK
jgi:hypothetical protein